ncbi:MAG: GntR family transcriptional regulator [Gammaproteobacteria bacterium]|nr:GntR family transcriptional regulator [Gammaproteobacteria bacterium]
MEPDGTAAARSREGSGSEVASQTGRALLGIRECLLRGEFSRRERISEVGLSERLQMSRTPIRMALERLAHLGLLDIGPKGGFFVREFTVADVRDAIEIRAVLEGTAARLAAERLAGDAELERLRGLRDQIDSLAELSVASLDYYMNCNEAFHVGIVELSKSPMLKRMLEQANSLPFASPNAMLFSTSMFDTSHRTLAIAQEQHRALVEAIENGEGTRAEHLAREHARLGRIAFDRVLSDPALLGNVPGGPLIKLPSD